MREYEPPKVLVDRLAGILARVDFGDSFPKSEYQDYATEVLEAIYDDGLQIIEQDEVFSANETGTDVSWGTAANNRGG